MLRLSKLFSFIILCGDTLAAPTGKSDVVLVTSSSLVERAPQADVDLLKRSNLLTAGLKEVFGGVAADLFQGAQVFGAVTQAIKNTLAGQATAQPASIEEAKSKLETIFSTPPPDFYKKVVDLATSGFIADKESIKNLLVGSFAAENSITNANTKQPSQSIFPQRNSGDAPYSLSEKELRQVIYIPKTFTYGQKPPVILIPGTGATGYQTFNGNFIPLLTNTDYADPVWLNIPMQLLGDIQMNAEYVAYAINYINGITSRNVSVITWSQGALDTQWALKYYPSTRSIVSNFIAISPDFHGTVTAYIVCPSFPTLPCPPSVIQQQYNSQFIQTLRANGGDSAYVPTTTIYSSTDGIVQPQSGTGASAYILDARNVGVSNNEVQGICGGRPAGTFYTHEGVLYNPLAFALAKDALLNGGPGRTDRLKLDEVCNQAVPPGLDLSSVLVTEQVVIVAGLSVAVYPSKVLKEPSIKGYATSARRM